MQLLSARASALTDRAMRAYFRSCERDGLLPLQPSGSQLTCRSEAGRTYVALTNVNGLLAAFSLRRSGRLHRLTRVPAAIRAGDEIALPAA